MQNGCTAYEETIGRGDPPDAQHADDVGKEDRNCTCTHYKDRRNNQILPTRKLRLPPTSQEQLRPKRKIIRRNRKQQMKAHKKGRHTHKIVHSPGHHRLWHRPFYHNVISVVV